MTSPAPEPSPVFRFLSVTEAKTVEMELNDPLDNSTLLSRGISARLEVKAGIRKGKKSKGRQSESPYTVTIHNEAWEIVMFYLQRSGEPVAVTLSTALCQQVNVPAGEFQKIPVQVWKQALTAFQEKVPHNFVNALGLATEWAERAVVDDLNKRLEQTLLANGMTPKELADLIAGVHPADGRNLAAQMQEALTEYQRRMAHRRCPPATTTVPRP